MLGFTKKDGFIFWFRILAIAVLICSTIACFGTFQVVTLDNQPIIQQLLGYNCSDFSSEICQSTEKRHYSLWGVQDEFTFHRSQALCHSSFSAAEFGFNISGPIEQLIGGNLGECNEASLIAAATLSVLTAFLACCVVVWTNIVSDHHEELYFSLKVHLWLSGATMICSLTVILIYVFAINPLRLDPTYCESQTLFSVCQQDQGHGFWLQVSTCVLCFLTVASGLRARRRDILGYDRESMFRESMFRNTERSKSSCGDKFLFCKSVHFWIKMGRLFEFILMLVGIMNPFTSINASVPPGSISRIPNTKTLYITSKINLWEDIFCSWNVLWWSYLVEAEPEPFGHCTDNELFHVKFASMKVLISSGLAMVLKRDARSNPLFYLIGIVMDFLSMVFISVAIGVFRGKIFPGREEVQPSYCDTWYKYVGTNCTVNVGYGFWFFCAVLVLSTVNFLVEFCIADKDLTYGARSAWDTVLRRVRQRRFKSVYKPQSERNVTPLGNPDGEQQHHELNLSAIQETADDSGSAEGDVADDSFIFNPKVETLSTKH